MSDAPRVPPVPPSAPDLADSLRIHTDPAVVGSFLDDAAHVPGGHAVGVAFPRDAHEVASLVRDASRVLPVGAQSSLTGGATPRGDLVLSTRSLRALTRVGPDLVHVGAGLPLSELQRALAAEGLYYPPVPTFDGATVGGTASTNAAGAATFKYGSTRPWVFGLTVVLADGAVVTMQRGEVKASSGSLDVPMPPNRSCRVPLPTYTMPRVAKLSAGYHVAPGMDLVDLFVGSEGTLGVIVDVTLRVIARPRRHIVLLRCVDLAQALRVSALLRGAALDTWAGRGTLDISAIELVDSRALATMPDDAFARAGVPRPGGDTTILLLQVESVDDERTLAALGEVLDRAGLEDDPTMAAPEDDRAAARLFELREAAPRSVNARVAAAKLHDERIEKTAGDPVVPCERLPESVALYQRTFEQHDVPYAMWGHVSDGNIHPNVVPRTFDDVLRGREAILAIARGVIALGGAPLAEHGVGRSGLKQQLLRELYGERGIDEMRAVKRALDPGWKLSPGVLFPPS